MLHYAVRCTGRTDELLHEAIPLVRIVEYAVRNAVGVAIRSRGNIPANTSMNILATRLYNTLTTTLIDFESAIIESHNIHVSPHQSALFHTVTILMQVAVDLDGLCRIDATPMDKIKHCVAFWNISHAISPVGGN